LDLEAHLLEWALELLDGELGAELDAFTERGLPTAERALGGDLDRPFALGDGRAGRHRGKRKDDEDTNDRASDGIPHRQPLLVGVPVELTAPRRFAAPL